VRQVATVVENVVNWWRYVISIGSRFFDTV